jgi:hypothetical protein
MMKYLFVPVVTGTIEIAPQKLEKCQEIISGMQLVDFVEYSHAGSNTQNKVSARL